MSVNKVKTRRGKQFLEARAPKLIENDKTAMIIRGGKTTDVITQALHELYLLKKPMVNRLLRKNPIHPFEDDTMLCKFSQKLDSSLFVFGSNTKKRPNRLVFGRMYDHQMLDMIELGIDKFVPSSHFKGNGITMGVKPCILLQGTLFESDSNYQRMGNLMIDFLQGAKIESVRLQGLELVIVLTATSEQKILLRVYKTMLMKAQDSSIPKIELVEIGPQFNFKLDRKKLASDELYKTALKKPKITKKMSDKNSKHDVFGNKVAKVHTGRQQIRQIQTRKVKAFAKHKKFDDNDDLMEMD